MFCTRWMDYNKVVEVDKGGKAVYQQVLSSVKAKSNTSCGVGSQYYIWLELMAIIPKF